MKQVMNRLDAEQSSLPDEILLTSKDVIDIERSMRYTPIWVEGSKAKVKLAYAGT